MAKNNTESDASKKQLHAHEIGDFLVRAYSFAKDPSESLFDFDGGRYQAGGETFVREQVKQFAWAAGLPDKWSKRLAEEVSAYILADAPLLWTDLPPDEINVKNGLLNLRTRELRPHDPKFMSTVQIPVTYNPDARCEHWDAFVESCFSADAGDLPYEVPAWTMSPGNPTQTAVMCVGEGANGKSTYLSGLSAFLGPENVAAVSLQKLEENRFAAARLQGKLANICPDIPNNKLASTSMFKALTGDDLIHAERKFKASFEFRSYAKLIFSVNQAPQADDPSHGFFRRWLVIPFDRTFDPGSASHLPRNILDEMLRDPDELSGVLNRALDLWPRVQAHGLSQPGSCLRARDEFKQVVDPLRAWLDRTVDVDPDGTVSKALLHEVYSNKCRAERRTPLSTQAFGRAMKRAVPGLAEGQRTQDGKRIEIYRGIRMRPVSLLPR